MYPRYNMQILHGIGRFGTVSATISGLAQPKCSLSEMCVILAIPSEISGLMESEVRGDSQLTVDSLA